MLAAVKKYYRLTKPGIVYGNLFHGAVGLLIAHQFGLHAWPAIGLLIGMATVIASACVANNLMDRSIDSKMKRTKRRALVTGDVDVPSAVLYLLILLTIGVVVLARMTNWLTLALALVAYVWYVWIYGWAKRTTWLSTLIGTVPGTLPVVAGYTALSNQFDTVAWMLFAVLTLWQLPHFYAIALYRQQEYAAAGLPVLSVVHGRRATYRQMILCAVLYSVSLVGLTATGGLALIPGSILVAAALFWSMTIYRGRKELTDKWARKVFGQSLLLTVVFMAAAALNLLF